MATRGRKKRELVWKHPGASGPSIEASRRAVRGVSHIAISSCFCWLLGAPSQVGHAGVEWVAELGSQTRGRPTTDTMPASCALGHVPGQQQTRFSQSLLIPVAANGVTPSGSSECVQQRALGTWLAPNWNRSIAPGGAGARRSSAVQVGKWLLAANSLVQEHDRSETQASVWAALP